MVAIDGLVSGMQTSSFIDSLMKIEALPQKQLQTTMSKRQSEAGAFRAIAAKVDALRVAAENLTKSETWSSVKTTSTAPSVTASASTSATSGTLTFAVQSVAATHAVISAGSWTGTSDPYGPGVPLTVYNKDGSTRGTITPSGSGSLADMIAAVNSSGMGLQATAVQTGPGQFRMQVGADASGAAKEFSLGTPGDFAVVTAGADARLTVGTGPGAYDVVSPTNEFKNVMSGVTLNVTKPETSVTVSTVADPDALAAKVQSLVDAANAALTDARGYTSASSAGKGMLSGDPAIRTMVSNLTQAVTTAVGTLGSAAGAGLQSDRNGKITFDKAKFSAAFAADPVLVRSLVMGQPGTNGADGVAGTGDDVAGVAGVAGRLMDVAARATDKATGFLVLSAQGKDTAVSDLKKRVEAWDDRLAARRNTLQRQFTSMETVLQKNSSQSSWLASQINSLPSWQ